ncbi:gamma-glutamyltranspeptidase/glutathione hydrolase [Bradyrhizobium elkanii]
MALTATMSRRLFAALLVIGIATPALGQVQRRFYEPSAADTIRSIRAENGMVVAQEKLAAQMGADILRQGGNAVDAAVATGFAMAVTYPRAGNIGGGGFMVIHLAGRNEDVAIDYRETAPQAATRDMFLNAEGKPDPDKSRNSALAIGVPGTVAGLSLALEKYGSGKFTLAQILKPAIDLARDGFIVTDDTSDTLNDMYRRMSRWPNSARTFSHADGTPLREGDRLIQGDLAGVLTDIAEQGPRGFYQGAVAEKLVSGIRNAGGIFTLEDLKSYQPVIRTPIRGSYRGYDIVSMPQPSSGGVVLLEILNILEGFPMSDMKQGSAASLHVMIEAMKRAYADRARYLGDPAFVDAPTQLLIDKDYAAKQRATIDLARATPWTDVRNAKQPHEGDNTTHYSVVDAGGNAVSNTYTLNFPYGVGLVADGTGVLLNNELDDFTAAPGASNAFGLVGFEANLPGTRQATAVVDVADHRAEGRQAGAGDGLARRQPHHLRGDADHRRRDRLQDGRCGRGRRAPHAPSMAARRGPDRARLSRRGAGRSARQGPQIGRAARLLLRELDPRHDQRSARRTGSAHARLGGCGILT